MAADGPGMAKALGKKAALAAAEVARDVPAGDKASAWAAAERRAAGRDWAPLKASDPLADDQPDRVVLFDDLRPYYHAASSASSASAAAAETVLAAGFSGFELSSCAGRQRLLRRFLHLVGFLFPRADPAVLVDGGSGFGAHVGPSWTAAAAAAEVEDVPPLLDDELVGACFDSAALGASSAPRGAVKGGGGGSAALADSLAGFVTARAGRAVPSAGVAESRGRAWRARAQALTALSEADAFCAERGCVARDPHRRRWALAALAQVTDRRAASHARGLVGDRFRGQAMAARILLLGLDARARRDHAWGAQRGGHGGAMEGGDVVGAARADALALIRAEADAQAADAAALHAEAAQAAAVATAFRLVATAAHSAAAHPGAAQSAAAAGKAAAELAARAAASGARHEAAQLALWTAYAHFEAAVGDLNAARKVFCKPPLPPPHTFKKKNSRSGAGLGSSCFCDGTIRHEYSTRVRNYLLKRYSTLLCS